MPDRSVWKVFCHIVTQVGKVETVTAMLAATTPEVAGDYVLFFDDYTGTDTTFSSLADGVIMMSVSALNGSLSRRSGFYPTITAASFTLNNLSSSGIKFVTSDRVAGQGNVVLSDTPINSVGSSDYLFYAFQDGAHMSFINCVRDWTNSAQRYGFLLKVGNRPYDAM